MELFLLPFKNAEEAQQFKQHINHIQHLSSTFVTPNFMSCSTDEFFTIYHEIDARTLIETLLYDIGYTSAYLYGTFAFQTEIIKLILHSQTWTHIPISKQDSFEQFLPKLALDSSLQKATLILLDETAIQTLRYYFTNDLNVIQTAKQMYIHRNTLNYRLSQIHEKTGIDPRTFYGAMYFFSIIYNSPISE